MNFSSAISSPHASQTPAFLIGVTGHMDIRPEEIDELKEHVGKLLRFIKPDDEDASDLNSVLKLLPDTSGSEEPDRKLAYRDALRYWQPLRKTPVVVLTSLAPGADTLVAEVVLDKFQDAGFEVVAALPLPREEYVESPTFVWEKASPEENQARQEQFDKTLKRIKRQFVVQLDDDMDRSREELEAQYHEISNGPEHEKARDQRYRAAGEFMAAFPHLMIAVWDHKHKDEESEVGTAAIVEARRGGPTYGLLPTTDPLAMPHGGPTFQLYTHRQKNNEAPD